MSAIEELKVISGRLSQNIQTLQAIVAKAREEKRGNKPLTLADLERAAADVFKGGK
jgi:hypothetical protein